MADDGDDAAAETWKGAAAMAVLEVVLNRENLREGQWRFRKFPTSPRGLVNGVVARIMPAMVPIFFQLGGFSEDLIMQAEVGMGYLAFLTTNHWSQRGGRGGDRGRRSGRFFIGRYGRYRSFGSLSFYFLVDGMGWSTGTHKRRRLILV